MAGPTGQMWNNAFECFGKGSLHNVCSHLVDLWADEHASRAKT